jgi:tripartite ATP-independent transporter DctP family solute receptor
MNTMLKKLTVITLLTAFVLASALYVRPVSAQEKFTIRIASVSGPGHTHNKVMREWAKKVKEETDGRLTLRVLDSAQLGGERDYIEGMQLGNIEMAQVSTGPISGFIPEFMVCSLPYVFQDYDQIKQVLNGPVGQKLFERLEEKGIKGLTWFTNGFRSVFNREKPIQGPDDLKGMKIRVMESPLMIGTLNAMGASATPMAYGELYTALQQGVMDGAENAPGNMLNDKFYEVSKYYTLTEHFAPPGVVAISMKTYNKLPEDLQEYLVESAAWLGDYEMAEDQKAQAAALEELEKKGVTINKVDKTPFIEGVKPVLEQFSEEIGPEIMDLVMQELQ